MKDLVRELLFGLSASKHGTEAHLTLEIVGLSMKVSSALSETLKNLRIARCVIARRLSSMGLVKVTCKMSLLSDQLVHLKGLFVISSSAPGTVSRIPRKSLLCGLTSAANGGFDA